MTSPAQRAAQSRYDAKRPSPISGRLSDAQRAWLIERAQPGETLFRTLMRLAGVPEIRPNDD